MIDTPVLGTLVIGFLVVAFLLYCAVEELREINGNIRELKDKTTDQLKSIEDGAGSYGTLHKQLIDIEKAINSSR